MNKFLGLAGAAILAFSSCNQKTFTVNGVLAGFEEGTSVYLSIPRFDKNGYFTADSTHLAADGKFTLTTTIDKKESVYVTTRVWNQSIDLYREKRIYGAPGKTVRITGENDTPETWQVKSRIPEQKELDRFDSVVQNLAYDQNAVRSELIEQIEKSKGLSPMERDAMQPKTDSLQGVYFGFQQEINRAILNTILENPKSEIALDKLETLAWYMGEEDHVYAMRDDIEKAYGMLSPEFQKTVKGENIYNSLYHPKLKEGRLMPQAELTDRNGQPQKLSAFSGKYILLHFWISEKSTFESLPEIKAFAEKHTDDIHVVGINVDRDPQRWRETAEKYGISWDDLRAEEGNLLLDQVSGNTLTYVLISPDGIVLRLYFSFAPGKLEEEFLKIKNQ